MARINVLERTQRIERPLAEVFSFYADAGNLERITPPLLGFNVVDSQPEEMRVGTLIQYELRLHGLPIDWLTRIEEWVPGERFVDMQLVGPYRLWHHTHTFEDRGEETLMRDRVRYAVPMWPLGELAMPLIHRDLKQIFDFRRDNVVPLLAAGP